MSRHTVTRRRCGEVLQVKIRSTQPGRRWIELSGELTEAAAQRLADYLDQAFAEDDRIVVDLRGLQFIDSESVRMLLLAHLRAADDQRQLTLIPGPPSVQAVIDHIDAPFSYGDVS